MIQERFQRGGVSCATPEPPAAGPALGEELTARAGQIPNGATHRSPTILQRAAVSSGSVGALRIATAERILLFPQLLFILA